MKTLYIRICRVKLKQYFIGKLITLNVYTTEEERPITNKLTTQMKRTSSLKEKN